MNSKWQKTHQPGVTQAKPDEHNGKMAVRKHTKINHLPSPGLELEHTL